MRTLNVSLGTRSYPIKIKSGLLDSVGSELKEFGFKGAVVVVTNPLVGGLYLERVINSLKGCGLTPLSVEIPDGEEYKTLAEISKVYDFLVENRTERTVPLLALGGGVIGDMTGFIAATYLRGVPFIQIPTTLLSEVDSSVGGKTGVNHPQGKNLIGAFYQPQIVLIDPDTLVTLEPRDYKSGLAEVVKYGVIRDPVFFEFIKDNIEALALYSKGEEIFEAIERSCAIKAEIVGADEREGGVRATLNLGHTFGHALESLSGYGTLRHGEAVSIGMVMASEFSLALGLCTQDVVQAITSLLQDLGLPTEVPSGFSAKVFLDSMLLDKKVTGGQMRFVLPIEIGKVIIREVEQGEVLEFLGKVV